jgi:hypothetical protein
LTGYYRGTSQKKRRYEKKIKELDLEVARVGLMREFYIDSIDIVDAVHSF